MDRIFLQPMKQKYQTVALISSLIAAIAIYNCEFILAFPAVILTIYWLYKDEEL